MNEALNVSIEIVQNAIATLLSILIIFHFLLSLYYGTRMIIIKKTNRFGWCPEMLVTYNSILWIFLFIYVLYSDLNGNPVVDNSSFGAVFIRPVILITSVITAILQRRRYKKAYVKFKFNGFLKEEPERED